MAGTAAGRLCEPQQTSQPFWLSSHPSPSPIPQTPHLPLDPASRGDTGPGPSTSDSECLKQYVSEAPALDQSSPNVFSMKNSPAGSHFLLPGFCTHTGYAKNSCSWLPCKIPPTSKTTSPWTLESQAYFFTFSLLVSRDRWQMTSQRQTAVLHVVTLLSCLKMSLGFAKYGDHYDISQQPSDF